MLFVIRRYMLSADPALALKGFRRNPLHFISTKIKKIKELGNTLFEVFIDKILRFLPVK